MKNEIFYRIMKGSLKSIVLKLLSENKRMYGSEITQTVENPVGWKNQINLWSPVSYPS
jgi:DNA-binding PadR family transcriptional regulator